MAGGAGGVGQRRKTPVGHVRIGEIARRAGVSRGTIQHYVREGLLPAPVKTHPNMGYYDPACVERVRLIQRLRETRRLPLAEIRRVLGRELEAGRSVARTLIDAQREVGESLSERTGSVGQSLTPAEASDAFGIEPVILQKLREARVIETREFDGRDVIEGHDLEVLAAIANLVRLGFTAEAGFAIEGVVAYQRAIDALVQMEFDMFLETLGERRPGADPVALAQGAIEGATLLIVALRKKKIGAVLELLGEVDERTDSERATTASPESGPGHETSDDRRERGEGGPAVPPSR